MAPKKRILIIRPSSIGDIVMASPMLPVLREAYPRAHIAWLVEPAGLELIRNNPLLDETICWSKNEWVNLFKKGRWGKLARGIRDFVRSLRERKFDLAIDAQGLLRSRLLARLTGAPNRLGIASKEPGSRLMTRIIDRQRNLQQISSEYRLLMQELGLPLEHFQLHLQLDREAHRNAHSLLQRAGIENSFVAICPFTTRPQKHWYADRWTMLSKKIHTQLGLPVVLLGGTSDRLAAESLLEQAEGSMHGLVGTTTIAESAAVVARCKLVIGVDTGLTHMGIAFSRPTIALFGPTRPYLETGRDNAVVIYHPEDCSPCRRTPTCDGDFRCLRSITVDEVLGHAARLLQTSE